MPYDIAWDGDLLETIVSQHVEQKLRRGERDFVMWYSRERDVAYEAPGEARLRRLDALNSRVARKLGLTDRLERVLDEFESVVALAQRIAIVPPPPREEETIELRKTPGQERGTLLVVTKPDRWMRDAAEDDRASAGGLVAFLRHDLTHLEDALDPAFGPGPDSASSGAATQGARDMWWIRRRALWCALVDRRLEALGQVPLLTAQERATSLERAFPGVASDEITRALEVLAADGRPTGRSLARVSGELGVLAKAASGRQAFPGRCPLCGFPTVQWADVSALPDAVLAALARDARGWKPDDGLCGRCAEAYVVRVAGLGAVARIGPSAAGPS
jgi:hypothetical protein